MKINREMRIVTACRGGQVRSVSARYILEDRHGCRKVIACGLEKNDYETQNFLFGWAEVILVVGVPLYGPCFPKHFVARQSTSILDLTGGGITRTVNWWESSRR